MKKYVTYRIDYLFCQVCYGYFECII